MARDIRSRLAYWLTPDLAMAAALAGLVFTLFVFQAPVGFFRDGDAGWHIRAGEIILNTGRLPQHEPFSFVILNPPWRAWEWGSEILMAAEHRAAGLPGVVFLYTATLGVAFWLWFRLHRKTGGNILIACLMASPFVATTQFHWLARPHLFSFVFLLAMLLWLETERTAVRIRDLAIAFAGAALWANLHASFVLFPVIAGLYAVAWFWRPSLWLVEDPKADRRQAGVYALLALAAAAGSLVNPYGWRLPLHVAGFFGNPAIRVGIAEWEPWGWNRPGSEQIVVVVVLCVAGAACALWNRKPHYALVLGFLIWSGLAAARGLPLLAIGGLPLANGAMAAVLARIGSRKPGSLGSRLLRTSDDLLAVDRTHSGAALAPIALLATFFYLTSPAVAARTGFPAALFPVNIAPAIEKLPANARIFSSIAHGGYLLYRFEGRRKVYIDGRIDYYGPQYLFLYRAVAGATGDWDKLLEKLRVTHVLVGNDLPLAAAMRTRGWNVVDHELRFTLFEVPPTGSNDLSQ